MPSEENMTTRSAEPTPRSVFRAEADPTVSTSARHARAVNAGTTRRQLGYIEALSLPLLPRMTRGPYAFRTPNGSPTNVKGVKAWKQAVRDGRSPCARTSARAWAPRSRAPSRRRGRAYARAHWDPRAAHRT